MLETAKKVAAIIADSHTAPGVRTEINNVAVKRDEAYIDITFATRYNEDSVRSAAKQVSDKLRAYIYVDFDEVTAVIVKLRWL